MIVFQGIKDINESSVDIDLRGVHNKRGCFAYSEMSVDNRAIYDAMTLMLSEENLSITDLEAFDAYFDITTNSNFSGNALKTTSELSQNDLDTVNDFINMAINL